MPTPSILTVTSGKSSAGTTDLQFAHTVDAAANAVLVYLALGTDASSIGGLAVSVGGVACTELAGTVSLTGTSRRGSWWYLFNPATGSQTVRVQITGVHRMVVHAHSVQDLDTTSEAAAFGTSPDNASGAAGTDPALATTDSVPALYIDGVMVNFQDTQNLTTDATQTETAHDSTTNTGTTSIEAACSTEVDPANMTWVLSGTDSGWNQSGVALKGAAAAADIAALRRRHDGE